MSMNSALRVILPFVIAVCASFASMVFAQNGDDCAANMKRAQSLYDRGDFDPSIQLVNECLARPGFPDANKGDAYALLAQNYLGKSLVTEAKNKIRELLKLVPNYQAPMDAPEFSGLVESVRKEETLRATITVTEPSAGTVWTAGETHIVRWLSRNSPGKVNILLSTDGGATFPLTLSSSVEDDGNEMVTMPDVTSESSRVKVEFTSDKKVFSTSSSNFRIDNVQAESSFPKTWHLIVGGAAVAAGVFIWCPWCPDEPRTPLPGPPGRPTGQ